MRAATPTNRSPAPIIKKAPPALSNPTLAAVLAPPAAMIIETSPATIVIKLLTILSAVEKSPLRFATCPAAGPIASCMAVNAPQTNPPIIVAAAPINANAVVNPDERVNAVKAPAAVINPNVVVRESSIAAIVMPNEVPIPAKQLANIDWMTRQLAVIPPLMIRVPAIIAATAAMKKTTAFVASNPKNISPASCNAKRLADNAASNVKNVCVIISEQAIDISPMTAKVVINISDIINDAAIKYILIFRDVNKRAASKTSAASLKAKMRFAALNKIVASMAVKAVAKRVGMVSAIVANIISIVIIELIKDDRNNSEISNPASVK